MYSYLQKSYFDGDAVDYLEFGVFKGVSISQWAGLNQHKQSRFFGFDSFEGMPENWRPGQEKGHFAVGGVMPQFDDPRIRFIKGWFEDTVPQFVRNFSPINRLVLHLDADLYASTMLPLIHFTPLMRAGTLLIFDEFYDRNHEFKAFMDWQRIYKKRIRIAAQMERYGKICAELL
jgi:O-methyltransferase